MKSKYFLIAGLTVVMITSSCSEYLENDALSSSQSLTIEVSDANLNGKTTTRAAYSGYTTTFESGDIIGLYVVKGSRVINANIPYTFNGTAWTTSSTVEYNDSYSYYAYYPYIASPYTPNFAQSTVDGKFGNFLTDDSNKFHKADQSTKANYQASDLMIAEGEKTGSKTVSFAMLHKKGLAVFDGDGAAGASFTGNIPYLMGTMKYFLMKPSTSTSFTDDEGSYTLSAASGRYVTHNIEGYTNFFLNVTGPSAFSYAGGTDSYSIQSYKQNSVGTKSKAAAWTASYDTNGDGVFNDSKPSWLTAFTESGDGSTAASNYSATVSAQSAMSPISGSASAILAAATAVGSSSDYYDLSTNGGSSSMTTANCYMVHAPGYYKVPLVYGNAIKNGTDNTVAYKPTGDLSNGTNNFVNHAGSNISAPWITKSGSGVNGGMNITVNGAQLIWQDVNGLTTNYTIEGDYLKFQVPAGSIAEGNAVIAVKTGSTIVWSWHIWVTPQTYSNRTTVATGSHNYSVTPVNLGWVGSSNVTKSGYEGRSCTVKITQTGGDSKTFTVAQAENITVTVSKTGNNPFFQWGRKDAFPPSNGIANDKTVYVGSGVDSKGWYYEASTTSTIGTTIQYPWKYYFNSSTRGPVTTKYYNMWDAQNNTTNNVTTATKKTIYDPCPPGFCVPTGNLWYYFGDGETRAMSTFDDTNNGATWNTGITGDALWLPAAGMRRNNTGAVWLVRSNGFYWSATPPNATDGRYLRAASGGWYWGFYNRAYGFSVRPVAEE